MNAKRRCAISISAALALTACGDDGDEESSTGAGDTGPAVATVKLSESEFKIEPASLQVTKSGVIQFDVKNTGQVTHALELEGDDLEEETEDIPAGGSASLKLNLEPGSYVLYCPIDGHKDKGMTGDVNVGLPASGGESEEEREREEEGGAEDSESGEPESEREREEEENDSGY